MELFDWQVQTDAAAEYLSPRIRRTPLEHSPQLSEHIGCPVYLKLESLQLTGSFKIRGALWKLAILPESDRARGIVTCSAGNHGSALAFAGDSLGVPVSVYLPSSVDPSKRARIEALGAATIVTEFSGFDESEEWAIEQARSQGKCYVSAYDDLDIMAANGGTVAREIITDLPEAKAFAVPVGGGGLAAGLSAYLNSCRRPFRLFGCQLEASPALRLSLDQGTAVTRLPAAETLAGGLEGGIGRCSFEVVRPFVSEVALLRETELWDSVAWLLSHHHYYAEVSAAAGLAAVLTQKIDPGTGPLIVVLTGRNMSLDRLHQILLANPPLGD